MTPPTARGSRVRRILRAVAVQMLLLVVTLGVLEAVLRVLDLRFLRDARQVGQAVVYRHDPDLGWMPIPNSVTKFVGSRTINVAHNSFGLRDIEPAGAANQTIVFLGDSFVWGYDAEADERFTEILRRRLPGHRIVNAGVSGYGTDQEYLLLQRLWSKLSPNVVVLMFCVDNDRNDNGSNSRYDNHYKPYFVRTADGRWEVRGVPVPKSRHAYFTDDPLVQNLWLARVAVSAYLHLRHPAVTVPDPTEHLIGMMRDFVVTRGAKFVVGLQRREPELEAYLRARNIPFTAFDGAEHYPSDGFHWTPQGHALVAAQLMTLFAETGIVARAPDVRP